MAFSAQQIHQIIIAKLSYRTTEQLIEDARFARANKDEETQRMIFALAMDVLANRMTESDFEKIYEEIAGE